VKYGLYKGYYLLERGRSRVVDWSYVSIVALPGFWSTKDYFVKNDKECRIAA
jgi:hypothetical protein